MEACAFSPSPRSSNIKPPGTILTDDIYQSTSHHTRSRNPLTGTASHDVAPSPPPSFSSDTLLTVAHTFQTTAQLQGPVICCHLRRMSVNLAELLACLSDDGRVHERHALVRVAREYRIVKRRIDVLPMDTEGEKATVTTRVRIEAPRQRSTS